ncbi:hypothetical protein [Pseudoclavibacter sp. CFCC 11306]|uniref:hypothetical protein n=1 Tax=Pseudoclavibacter sp. CFCC 11306 TaxID=1564493 RepID=UPI00130127EA|nr:hypothetical protein [Pseudoclavibacter sp. CFCC 11306]KAB1658172.1 hypothetical protein F8O09_00615 [Pseudoclavibacter sp. CFCC 11306]
MSGLTIIRVPLDELRPTQDSLIRVLALIQNPDQMKILLDNIERHGDAYAAYLLAVTATPRGLRSIPEMHTEALWVSACTQAETYEKLAQQLGLHRQLSITTRIGSVSAQPEVTLFWTGSDNALRRFMERFKIVRAVFGWYAFDGNHILEHLSSNK